MYKFTTHLANPNLILVRKQIGDASCTALVVMRAPRRTYAQFDKDACPPPPKAPPKARKILWTTIGATILTGAAVVYAKSSPDARNWLESNAPWANDFIALVYQENTTYWKATVNQISRATTAISNFMFGKEGVSPLDFQQRSEQDLEKDAAEHFAKKDYELPPPKFEPLYVQEKPPVKPELETKVTVIQTEECPPQQPPPIVITKDMVELEHDMHENTKLAIDSYKQAKKYCMDYNKALYAIVEAPIEDLDKKNFSSLRGAQNERDNLMKKAHESASKARCAIETLDRMIKAGVQAPPESIAATQRYIKKFRADLQEAETAYKEEHEKAVLSDRYWNKVEAARAEFKEELQMLFPGVDLSVRKLELHGDTDLLLMYTLKKVQYLQNAIAELQTVRELKINRAIECHDDKAIIDAKVEETIKRESLHKELEFQKKSLAIQAEANRRMKEQLKKQFEIQQEVLQDKLKAKDKEVLSKFNKAVSEEVEKERVVFKKDMAAMAGKLMAIEQTLKKRAKAEEEARRSQSLWAAAEALLSATRRSTTEAKIDNEIKALEKAERAKAEEEARRSQSLWAAAEALLSATRRSTTEAKIDNEIKALEKADNANRIKSIVVSVLNRYQKDDFVAAARKLTITAADLGLQGGTRIFINDHLTVDNKILLNKAKALAKEKNFAFTWFAEIPEDELNNKPTDFTKLDTFDIIQRARYHMDHGDLQSALRYVNLLQGAPRAAAGDWADAARHHLEVRQAAQAYPRQIDYRLVRISQSAINLKQFRKYPDREPCPLPPPPPKPKEKDDRILWGTVFLATLAGAFAYYAKQSPQTRDWLTIYAPWFDDMIAVIFQENMSYKEYLNECIESFKKYIHMGEKTDVCKIEEPPKAIPTVPEKPKEIIQPVKEVIEQPPCVRLPPPVLTKDICEVESCLKDLFETVVNNYDTAKAACVYYCQVVEDTMNDFTMPKLKELRKAMEERMDLVRVSIQNALEAQEGMEELTRYLDCGVQALPEAIEKTKEMMEQCQEKIKATLIQYQWENDKALVRDRQWQMKQDLEEELQEVVAGMKERADRAVDTTRSEDEKTERERKLFLENLTKLKRLELEKDFKTREENLKKRNDDMLKDALRKQLQRHEEILEKKLKQREIEATAKLNQMVADKVAAEKRLFAKQRTEMAAKLKILEDKLAAHLKAEKETKRSQELWAAGSSLLAATRRGEKCVNISKELKAVQKASGGEDKLVSTVMKSIPRSVWADGVVPDSVLKANYYKMEKTALKVALVELEGSPLPIYFISWLQSMFLFFKRGNLAVAIRYVARLEGASLVAAETWLEAARIHLEIRQAAEAIVAHAAALGLQYI
ncbi:Putative mitochondrial inner membrane protein [Papilio xuthus]|uniref:MICOS complex subunit MIC60 n=1 Tax=Papilio xuthus TaxID=66420 RepID=A0A194QDW5_PAPXU|nr:Putative mitochondrial inner membrane protein [Papilio xuthus]